MLIARMAIILCFGACVLYFIYLYQVPFSFITSFHVPTALLPILDASVALILCLVLSYPASLLSSTVITAIVVTGPFIECEVHKGFTDDVRILNDFTSNLYMSKPRFREVR